MQLHLVSGDLNGIATLPPEAQAVSAWPFANAFGSLRARLVALVLLALALPLPVVAWQLDRQAAARLQAAEREVLAAARHTVDAHLALIQEARALLVALSVLPQVVAAGPECTAAVTRLSGVLAWAAALVVTDVDGYVRCTSARSTRGVFVGDRPYFQAAVRTGGLVVSDVVAARPDGRPLVVVTLPTFDDIGVMKSVLIVSIDLGKLTRQAVDAQLVEGDLFALLLAADGATLRSHPEQNAPTSPELLAGVAASTDGVVHATDGAGVRQIFGFARLPQTSVSIAVGRAEAAVLAPVRAEALRLGPVVLVVTLLTAGFAWWFGQAILLRGIEAIGATARDGRLFSQHPPDRLAAPEVHALHASLVAKEKRREAIERRWRRLGEAGALIVWRAGPAGQLVEAHGWEAMSGADLEALATPDMNGLLHPDDIAPRQRALRQAIETGSCYTAEFRVAVPAADGDTRGAEEAAPEGRVWRWMQSRGVAVRDPAGHTVEWIGTLRDIDAQHRAAAALAAREAQLRSVLDTAVDTILVVDQAGRVEHANPAAERLFGWPMAELLGRDVAGLLQSGGDQPFGGGAAGEIGRGLRRDATARHRNGRGIAVEISVARFRDDSGREFHTGIIRDVTVRRAALLAIAESERRFRLLAENSDDVVMLSDLDGVRMYVSPASTRVLGWTPEQLVGLRAVDFAHPDDHPLVAGSVAAIAGGESASEATFRMRRPDGSWVWVEGRARANLGPDGRNAGYVVTLRDATERQTAQEQLRAAFAQMELLAATDSLTGLANRRRLDDLLRAEWRRAAREQLPLSLALLDADRFKLFNDRYGHPAGDECLRGIARALQAAARRPADLPARHGGEEFVMLLPATDPDGAALVGERIRALVEADGRLHESNPPRGVVTVSVGVATAFPWAEGGIDSPDALLSAADSALYAAKSEGRNRVVVATAPQVLPVGAA